MREKFKGSEAELCDAFAALAREDGWVVYPETGGDLLLVDPTDGYQISIEAKLRATCEVLYQALPPGPDHTGPRADEYAVLVPDDPGAFGALARRLGVRVFTAEVMFAASRRHSTAWKILRDWTSANRPAPAERLWVPPVPLARSGGQSAPRHLSKWRVGCLYLCRMLRAGVPVYGSTFKSLGVDRSRWLALGWAKSTARRGPCGTLEYERGPWFDGCPQRLPGHGPDHGYEVERDALPPWDPPVVALKRRGAA